MPKIDQPKSRMTLEKLGEIWARIAAQIAAEPSPGRNPNLLEQEEIDELIANADQLFKTGEIPLDRLNKELLQCAEAGGKMTGEEIAALLAAVDDEN